MSNDQFILVDVCLPTTPSCARRVPAPSSDGGGPEDHTRRGVTVRDFNLQAWTLGRETFRAWVCMFGSFFQVDMCMCAYACAPLCAGQLSPWRAHSAMKYPTHALRTPSRLAAPGQASASCSSSAFCSSETHLDGVTVGFG